MTRSVLDRLYSIYDVCSGFGSYMMNLHSRCLDRRSNGGCEGGPTPDETRRDDRRMHTPSASFYPFGF